MLGSPEIDLGTGVFLKALPGTRIPALFIVPALEMKASSPPGGTSASCLSMVSRASSSVLWVLVFTRYYTQRG